MSEVRLAIKEDAAMMEHISKSSMSSFWRAADFEDAIESPNAVVVAAIDEGIVAGYAVMYFAADEGEIPSIATHRDHRRKGIGTQLLNTLHGISLEKKLSKIFLEVRESNVPAHVLYEKSGFILSGSRRDFYDNPREDADIMVRLLNS